MKSRKRYLQTLTLDTEVVVEVLVVVWVPHVARCALVTRISAAALLTVLGTSCKFCTAYKNSEKNNKAEEDKKTTFYLLIILMFLNKIWSNSKNI